MNILTTSTNTSSLLKGGYKIIAIRPIVKAYVQKDGSVTLKATQAFVTLTNGSGITEVLVDITNNTATVLNTISRCHCPCVTTNNQTPG